MNLEHLNIAIRPRRDWEAVDLGLLMAQRWWRPMLGIWLLVTLPWLLLSLVVPMAHMGWVFLAFWWFKPLYERPLLMILSQGVFGVELSRGELLRNLPKLMLRQSLASLTWRRFSFSRSMDVAVVQLEELHGTERFKRLNVLHRDDASPAKWLTVIGIHLESFFAIALIVFVFTLIPEQIQIEFFDLDFWLSSRAGLVAQMLTLYLSAALVAPFYVACGFSLYLNRRVKLEGWDLEIAFKRMVQKRGVNLSGVVAALLSISVLLSSLPQVAHAEEAFLPELSHFDGVDTQLSAEEQAWQTQRNTIKQSIGDIVSGELFHQKEMIKTLKQTEPETSEPENFNFEWVKSLLNFLAATAPFLNFIASFAEIVLWAAVIALAIFVALKFRTWQAFFTERGYFFSRPAYRPTTLFGMDVTQESLPEDISATALALWQQQQWRAALALLYRASLTRLIYNGLALRDGTTEQECLALLHHQAQALQMPPPTLEYFAELTASWRRLAYGHLPPAADVGQRLCQQWNQHWLGDGNDR